MVKLVCLATRWTIIVCPPRAASRYSCVVPRRIVFLMTVEVGPRSKWTCWRSTFLSCAAPAADAGTLTTMNTKANRYVHISFINRVSFRRIERNEFDGKCTALLGQYAQP